MLTEYAQNLGASCSPQHATIYMGRKGELIFKNRNFKLLKSGWWVAF